MAKLVLCCRLDGSALLSVEGLRSPTDQIAEASARSARRARQLQSRHQINRCCRFRRTFNDIRRELTQSRELKDPGIRLEARLTTH